MLSNSVSLVKDAIMNFIYPLNVDEHYVKGNFTSAKGLEVYTEIPAVFNEDGSCNVEATQAVIDNMIGNYNNYINSIDRRK